MGETTKRALVLSGGGARGSFQVGMLKELVLNRGLDFDVIRGVSVGALNAALLAQADLGDDSLENLRAAVRDLATLWTDTIRGNHSVYRKRAAGFAGLALGADSLFSVEPLKRLIRENISIDRLKASKRNFRIGTVSLLSGKFQDWGPEDHDEFLELLLASTAVPVVYPFQTLEIEGEADVLVDGGVRDITPLKSAMKEEPQEVYVLLASRLLRTNRGGLPISAEMTQDFEMWDDNFLGTSVNGLDVLKRTVALLTDEVYLGDLRRALRWNRITTAVDELAARANAMGTGAEEAAVAVKEIIDEENRRFVDIKIIAPREWYGDDNDSTQFSPRLIRESIAHGEAVAADESLWVWPPVGPE